MRIWANLKAKKESRGDLPLRKDKYFIDLLRGKRISPGNQTDILQTKLTTTIPDSGEIGNGHTNGSRQIFILVTMSTHNRLKQFFIHSDTSYGIGSRSQNFNIPTKICCTILRGRSYAFCSEQSLPTQIAEATRTPLSENNWRVTGSPFTTSEGIRIV